MNKQKAKRIAHRMVAESIRHMRDVRWPYSMGDPAQNSFTVDEGGEMVILVDAAGELTKDGTRLKEALEGIVLSHEGRAKSEWQREDQRWHRPRMRVRFTDYDGRS